MQVDMVQHAVGQGGLFSGALRANAPPLRWLYDCGSNQRDALSREINFVAGGGDIDRLFLSHLDSDHVGGVDQLLMQVKVREVVLPYLDNATLVAILARDVARGVLTGLFVEAVRDLASWFGGRGVDTITFVNGAADEGGGDGPFVPDDPEGDGGEGAIGAKWTREPRPVVDMMIGRAANRLDAGSAATIQQVGPDSALQLHRQRRVLNWALIPYVHVPPAQLMHRFEDALEAEFGAPLDMKKIILSAQDRTVRDKLRSCYDALWLDHNLISMSLYSGPLNRQLGLSFFRSGTHYWLGRHDSGEVGGWLLTGDAHLDGPGRRQRFLHFYRRFTPLTKVLMLPHHGSIYNHSPFVLAAMPDLQVGYAASGPNSYGHPHNSVRDDVDAHGRARFHRVTHQRSTQLVMCVHSP